jgi:hypothetical protein
MRMNEELLMRVAYEIMPIVKRYVDEEAGYERVIHVLAALGLVTGGLIIGADSAENLQISRNLVVGQIDQYIAAYKRAPETSH